MKGNNGQITSSSVGSLLGVGTAPAQLRYRSTLTETYNLDQFEAYVRLRFMSGGYYEPAFVETLDKNHVGDQYYFDLGASYYLSDDKTYQVYANVVNALDRPPPVIPVPTFYDMFGRMYNVGLRFNF
jgi:hypothetical protein